MHAVRQPRPMHLLLQGLLLAALLLLLVPHAGAQRVLPVPALTARVMDQTRTLGSEQRAALERKLADLERDKGAQVVILMVPTTAPEDIAAYANRVGQDWKIGRGTVGDGLIVVVAKDDRRMRIEVAKTLEGAVPDIAAGRIINNIMAPYFRQGDYYGGLNAALDQIDARIRGEPLPPVTGPATAAADDGVDWFGLLVLLLIFTPAINAFARHGLGRKLGALATGGGIGVLVFAITASLLIALMAAVIALVFGLSGRSAALFSGVGDGGGWRGGGGSRGGGWGGGGGLGSGGGFSSGGGGSFGGGGASGGW